MDERIPVGTVGPWRADTVLAERAREVGHVSTQGAQPAIGRAQEYGSTEDLLAKCHPAVVLVAGGLTAEAEVALARGVPVFLAEPPNLDDARSLAAAAGSPGTRCGYFNALADQFAEGWARVREGSLGQPLELVVTLSAHDWSDQRLQIALHRMVEAVRGLGLEELQWPTSALGRRWSRGEVAMSLDTYPAIAGPVVRYRIARGSSGVTVTMQGEAGQLLMSTPTGTDEVGYSRIQLENGESPELGPPPSLRRCLIGQLMRFIDSRGSSATLPAQLVQQAVGVQCLLNVAGPERGVDTRPHTA